ncbi:MAG: hypothetical protein HY554_04160 [Elusimicrobia bacterium]|nr:hypothetical protein [Elusimicrobiota bacterium]
MADQGCDPGGAEPVRSGSFRIDRKRALELLSRFQLRSPYLFPLAWVRSAVASGADSIEIRDAADRFELRFGGRPFPAEELQRLFDCLPAERPDPRLRELARGALTALPLGARLFLRSGGRGERRALTLEAAGESCAAIEEEDVRTALAVLWGAAGRPEAFAEGVAALRASCLPGLARFSAEEKAFGDLPQGPLWEPASEGGARGWIAAALPGRPSELRLHALGVLAEARRLWLDPAGPQLRAVVDDHGLSLSVSQDAVVEDEVFGRLRERLRSWACALAERRCRELSKRMPAIGAWLRDPVLFSRWELARNGGPDPTTVDGLLGGLESRFALEAGAAAGREADVEQWAPVVAWLRELALRLFRDGRKPSTPLERLVWSAPLYLTAEGLPATLDELERLRLRCGRLALGRRPRESQGWSAAEAPLQDRVALLDLLNGPLGDRLGEL